MIEMIENQLCDVSLYFMYTLCVQLDVWHENRILYFAHFYYGVHSMSIDVLHQQQQQQMAFIKNRTRLTILRCDYKCDVIAVMR